MSNEDALKKKERDLQIIREMSRLMADLVRTGVPGAYETEMACDDAMHSDFNMTPEKALAYLRKQEKESPKEHMRKYYKLAAALLSIKIDFGPSGTSYI